MGGMFGLCTLLKRVSNRFRYFDGLMLDKMTLLWLKEDYFPSKFLTLNAVKLQRMTNKQTALPGSLTKPADSEGSTSGGGVSVSMERTGAS